MLRRPMIHQTVCRAGVETDGKLVPRTEMGRTVMLAIPPRFSTTLDSCSSRISALCSARGQRRALTTSRHIASTKVGNRRDAGALGDYIRVTQLQGHRRSPVRRVRHRLSVTADG